MFILTSVILTGLSCAQLKTSKLNLGNTSSNQNITSEDIRSPDGLVESLVFDWPVNEARMTRGFLPNKKRPHLGIDLAAPRGTEILAAHNGYVIYTGKDFKGFGKMVLVESGSGWATLYAHLDKILVKEGETISQGHLIGKMGRTGRATGVHLHFEIRKHKGPVDPLMYLPSIPKYAHN